MAKKTSDVRVDGDDVRKMASEKPQEGAQTPFRMDMHVDALVRGQYARHQFTGEGLKRHKKR